MHCEHCGSETKPGARFCAGCGRPLDEDEARKDDDQASSPSWRERAERLLGGSRRERLLACGTIAAIVVAIAAFVLLDTDDGADNSFTKAADRQCVAAKRQIGRLQAEPALAGEAGARPFAIGVLTTVVAWQQQYQELFPAPSSSRAAAGELDDSLSALTIDLGALARDLRNGKAEAIAEASTTAEEATAEVESAIDSLGLGRCGGISLSAPSAS